MFHEKREKLIIGLIFLLAEVILTNATHLRDHTRSKRQVTYTEKANDSKEDVADPDHEFHLPVTKRPLPSQLAYPGDLSRFFKSSENSEKSSEPETKKITNNTSEANSSVDERTLKRRKRGGGYIVEKKEKGDTVLEYGFKNEPLLYSASTLGEFIQKKNSNKGFPAELSFDGAGFLRMDDDSGVELHSFEPTGTERNGYELSSGNARALKDFRVVFNTALPKKSKRYDDEGKNNHGDRALIKMTLEKKVIPKGSVMVKVIDRLRNSDILKNHPGDHTPKAATLVKLIRQSNSGGVNRPLLLSRPQYFSDRSAAKLPQHTEESFINYHISNPFQIRPRMPLSGLMFSYAKRLPGRKVFRRKRSTSTHISLTPAPVKNSESSENTSQESRKNYRMEKKKDQQGADSGFIPITGSYDGGVIHLSLPYYGGPGPQAPSYGSPPSVHVIHAYPPPPPRGAQSRYYGSSGTEHFFHPSEARRFSHGVLGSGNFEVIRGGIFPDDDPTHGRHAGRGRGYPGDRVPFDGGSYTTYGGTTEIIFDGPIQGFQGFDNFPAQLINALSKHGDVTVHVPPERRRDESQLIPVTYPLQAVS